MLTMTTLPPPPPIPPVPAMQFELRFQSLFDAGKALSFPCDETGHVPLDALSARALENYLYARAVVGRDYAAPQLCVAAAPICPSRPADQ